MSKKFSLIKIFASFFLFYLLSLRKIIVSQSAGIGHNWDWNFSAFVPTLKRVGELSVFSWNNFNLGGPLNLHVHLGLNLFVSLFSFMGARYLFLLVITAVVSVAFISFKKLADYLIDSTYINYLPALLFSFSPFLFNEITGGSWYMWVSYAFSPLYFLYLIRFIKGRDIKDFIFLSLSSLFVVASTQNFISLEIIVVLYLIAQVLIKPRSLKSTLLNFSLAHLGLIMIHSFWIFPFLYQARSYFEIVTSAAFTGNFAGVKENTQNIQNIFSLAGYLDRNMYSFAVPGRLINLFYISVSSIWILIVIALFKDKKKTNRINFIVWITIFLLLILLIKGGNVPFSELTMTIFEKLPGMSIYRSPQHLMFFASFIIPLLVCFSLNFFARIDRKKAVTIYLFFTLFWLIAWWFNGDLGSTILRASNRDHIDLYSLNPDLKEIYELNETSSLNHRILFLPTVYSPFFLDNDYQKDAQGGQPEYYMKNPTFSSEYNKIANLVDEKICLNKSYDMVKLLSITNVRFLAVRNDITPAHTSCYYIWPKDRVETYMAAYDKFQLVSKGEYASLYRLKDDYFLPIIYTSTENKMLNGSKEMANEYAGDQSLSNDPRSTLINMQQNLSIDKNTSNLTDYQFEKDVVVEYKKVNPVNYQVIIHGAKEKIFLVLNENFSEGWKLYPVPTQRESSPSTFPPTSDNTEGEIAAEDLSRYMGSGLISRAGPEYISKKFQNTIQNDNLLATSLTSTLFKKPLDTEKNHLIANGYSNGWAIDIKNVCGKTNICTVNNDGTYNLELSLEYWPQRIFYLGLIISSCSFLFFLLTYLLMVNQGYKQ